MNLLKLVLMIAILGFVSLVTPSVAHSELVINGGFESGSLSPWNATNINNAFSTTTNPHSGGRSFTGFQNTGVGTLSQVLNTTNGTVYDYSFWAVSGGTAGILPGNILRIQFDSNPIQTVVNSSSYSQTTGQFVATGSTTTLKFLLQTGEGGGAWSIDDVSVNAVTAIPEPGSFELILPFAVLSAGWFLCNPKYQSRKVSSSV